MVIVQLCLKGSSLIRRKIKYTLLLNSPKILGISRLPVQIVLKDLKHQTKPVNQDPSYLKAKVISKPLKEVSVLRYSGFDQIFIGFIKASYPIIQSFINRFALSAIRVLPLAPCFIV